jgi:HEAT repeat protein
MNAKMLIAVVMAGLTTGMPALAQPASSADLSGGQENRGELRRGAELPPQKIPNAVKEPPAVAREVPTPLDATLRAKAQAIILELAGSSSEVIRCNATEAAQRTLGPAARGVILNGLSDPSPLVQFAALVAAGETKLLEAYEPILKLSYHPDVNVRLAVRFALHKLGDRRMSNELLLGLSEPRMEVRSNTLMLLGLLKEKSAVPAVRPLLADQSPTVRLQAAETLWRLREKLGFEELVAKSISRYPDEQIVALVALAGPNDPRVIDHIRSQLINEYTEVALAAARGCGMLGYDDGFTIAIRAAKSDDPRQRVLAAFALGAIGRSDSQAALAPLLEDADTNVKLAAATAIMQLREPGNRRTPGR